MKYYKSERHKRSHIIGCHLYEKYRIDKSTETGSSLVVARGLVGGNTGTANGYGVSFWSDKNVLESNNSYSCINL